MNSSLLLTPSEAAKILGVAPTTIRHWAQTGRLPFVTTPGGHRRFKSGDVQELLSPSKHNIENTFSILIIEDDQEFADMLNQLLGNYFPDVHIKLAYNGFDAGDLLHKFKPDLVILDLMMPHINGFDICSRIKSAPSTKHINVIAMTGALTTNNQNKIIELGAEVCLEKPLNFQLVQDLISKFIQEKGTS